MAVEAHENIITWQQVIEASEAFGLVPPRGAISVPVVIERMTGLDMRKYDVVTHYARSVFEIVRKAEAEA